VPRFEYVHRAIPERRGVNPFTRETIVIPGRPERIKFFEVEQRGTSVLYASGEVGEAASERRTEHPNEDEAFAEFATAVAKKRRAGFQSAGAVRVIEGGISVRKGSALLLDEYFAAGDARFLDELLCFDGAKKLASLAKPWFEDPRAFARRALLAYVADGCDRAGHKALVKRLFKLAETAKDHELMAEFMVAFDRWSRRPLRRVSWEWDAATRRARPVMGLTNDPTVRERLGKGANETEPQFTRVTRRYLTRRAFRYFRRIGYTNPALYRKAVLLALQQYRDEHLGTVGRLFSAWGLLHVLYGRSPVLVRHPSGIRLTPGRTLAELNPAPIFPKAWQGAFEDLLALLQCAKSRTVRQWSLSSLRANYAAELSALKLGQVKELALSEHEEAQVLGVELFTRLPDLESVALSDWLELLGAQNLDVLSLVCDRAATVVSGARLGLPECIELTLSPVAPLASLGLSWLVDKPVTTPAELGALLRLTGAKVASVRLSAAEHLAQQLRTLPFVQPLHVRELCDAAHVEVRGHGLAVAAERFGADLSLWSALCESPYTDVKSFVVSRAAQFQAQPAETLAHVFGAVLCALSGAARDKRRVAAEIARRVASRPEQGPALMPLLRLTLASVHPSERNLSLAALARVTLRNEPLRALVAARFPELTISAQASE